MIDCLHVTTAQIFNLTHVNHRVHLDYIFIFGVIQVLCNAFFLKFFIPTQCKAAGPFTFVILGRAPPHTLE